LLFLTYTHYSNLGLSRHLLLQIDCPLYKTFKESTVKMLLLTPIVNIVKSIATYDNILTNIWHNHLLIEVVY